MYGNSCKLEYSTSLYVALSHRCTRTQLIMEPYSSVAVSQHTRITNTSPVILYGVLGTAFGNTYTTAYFPSTHVFFARLLSFRHIPTADIQS
jgi:hypothetical protein